MKLKVEYDQKKARLNELATAALTEGRAFTEAEATEIASLKARLEVIKSTIDAANEIASLANIEAPKTPMQPSEQAGATTPGVLPNIQVGELGQKANLPFKNMADQMASIRTAGLSGGANVDPRLGQINQAAATGASTAVGQDGGYLIQENFLDEMLKAQWTTGVLASRVSRGTMTGNRVSYPIFRNFDSTGGSISGGIKVFTTKEAQAYTATKPVMDKVHFDAMKLTALFYETDELKDDVAAIASLVQAEMPDCFADKIDYLLINGTGVDEFLGLLNCPALIEVAKKGGQAAATTVTENIVNMYARLPAADRASAVWLYHAQMEEQFPLMTVGGSNYPVYMQPGTGMVDSPFGRIRGLPAIPFQHSKALGAKGDLFLVNAKKIRLLARTGLQAAMSAHVGFLNGEIVWRFDQRLAASPTYKEKQKLPDGYEQSPYIVLQARA